MKLKHYLVGIAACVLTSMAWAQQQPIVIKFSHVVAVNTPKGEAAEFFKKEAEARTKGRVQVQVFANSTLYKDKEEMEALQLGAVQLLAPTFSKFGPLGVKEFEVFDLPYLFDNLDEARRVTQGPLGRQLLDKLPAKGIVGLAFWDNAFKQMTANIPLRKVDDFKGKKLRIQSSKVLDSQMRALGALPQVLAFAEVYQALQTGVVDGQENPATNIYTQKFHEVQKYMTMTDHGYHGYVLISNKKFWDSLPPDVRNTLDGVIKDTTDYFYKAALRDEHDALASIKAAGRAQVITLKPEEKLELKKSLMKVHREVEPRVGKELVEAIYKETQFAPDKL